MLKWIIALVSIGMAGLTGFAYRLADARVGACWGGDFDCHVRTLAARDNTLILGLAICLIGFSVFAVLALRSIPRRAQPHQSAMPEGLRRVR